MKKTNERGDSSISVCIVAFVIVFCFLGIFTIEVTINGKPYSVNLGCQCSEEPDSSDEKWEVVPEYPEWEGKSYNGRYGK